jgi:hypothetical protein
MTSPRSWYRSIGAVEAFLTGFAGLLQLARHAQTSGIANNNRRRLWYTRHSPYIHHEQAIERHRPAGITSKNQLA